MGRDRENGYEPDDPKGFEDGEYVEYLEDMLDEEE